VGATSPTSGSTPRLSEVARHVVIPKGIATTGWPAVEAKCSELGITFRPWQQGAGRIILGKRPDGLYASTVGGTGLSIPRQVGKTFLAAAIVFALCLLFPKLTVVWTSHRLSTAEETFKKLQAFAQRKKIAPHVAKVILGSGEEEIRFRNGSRIMFGARERGFGRGFDELDVLIYDEAQILGEKAMDDMVPATNQSRQSTGALLLFMGTPPKPGDRDEVFTRMRTEALAGTDDDTGWIEFGADADFVPTSAPAPLKAADWAQVAKANPSYPHDTPRASILRMRKQLGPEAFMREGLGIWDEDGGSPIPADGWEACKDPKSRFGPGRAALGVQVTPDQRIAYIAGAGKCADDDRVHLEVLTPSGIGTTRAVDELVRLSRKRGNATVYLDGDSHAGALMADLEARGVKVEPLTLQKFTRGCGQLIVDVTAGAVRHRGQDILDDAVRAARVKVTTRESWRWAGPNIAPLTAVTFALHGFSSGPPSYDVMKSLW
jgi:hypothetical protein